MKKLFIILFLILAAKTAYAEDNFDDTLDLLINEHGMYDGKDGIIYASLENFYYGQEFLLTAYANDNRISCSAYTIQDGIECIDTLIFENSDSFTLSVGEYDDTAYIVCIGEKTEYFAIIDDSFTHIPELSLSSKKTIAKYENGKITSLSQTSQDIYNLRNDIRLQKINAYPYINYANTLDEQMRLGILLLAKACADIVEFDAHSYSYDKLFKYVLFTHENFKILSDIPTHTDKNGSVKMVSAEFIDDIMLNIFKVRPEHPSFVELTDRGFCYRDGMYLYTGGFDADYKTEIIDIIGAYDLGGGVYYILFSDIYTENKNAVPEYSYAIINTSDTPYSLLRLGMGKSPLAASQIQEYALTSDLTTPKWEQRGAKEPQSSFPVLPTSLSAVAAAAAAAVVFIVYKSRKS